MSGRAVKSVAEHVDVTPKGIHICFEDGLPDPDTGKGKHRTYTCGKPPKVPMAKLTSVTTALGVIDKAALKYAAERQTARALVDLARTGDLPASADAALSRLSKRQMRFFQVWDAKAERGNVTHDAIVKLMAGAPIPADRDFPLDQRDFVRGAAAFVADVRPKAIDTEKMVASLDYGFAGRFDFYGHLTNAQAWGILPSDTCRVDFKTLEAFDYYKDGTRKAPYDENLAQLPAYELAAVESGYPAADHLVVVRIDGTGAYDLCPTWIGPDVFLKALALYRERKTIAELKPEHLKPKRGGRRKAA